MKQKLSCKKSIPRVSADWVPREWPSGRNRPAEKDVNSRSEKQSRIRLPRLVYQDWIVQMGHDPDVLQPQEFEGSEIKILSFSTPWVAKLDSSEGDRIRRETEEVRQVVQKAVERLTDEEREFVRLYYYCGLSYGRIEQRTQRRKYRLEVINRRVIKKLRRLLSEFVRDRFGIHSGEITECALCRSRFRTKIDRLIESRGKDENWGKVMKALRKDFGIEIKTVSELIGHARDHGRLEWKERS